MFFEFCEILPPEYRSIVLFLIGVMLGVLANWLADHWGLRRRYRSPWSGLPEPLTEVISRKARDYIPILGWIFMRRFGRVLFTSTSRTRRPAKVAAGHTLSKLTFLQKQTIAEKLGIHSSTFWIRPMFVELFCGLFLAWFYSWMVVDNETFLESIRVKFHGIALQVPELGFRELLISFGVTIGFCFIMLCAALTDLDDHIIPDQVNVPGTLFGLIAMTSFPFMVFAPLFWYIPQGPHDSFATTDLATFFETYFGSMGGWQHTSLVIMICCWAFWCFALLDRCWNMKFGFRIGFYLFLRRLLRSPMTLLSLLLFLAGSGLIIWLYFGNPNPETTVCQMNPEYDYYSDEPLPVGFVSPRNALFNALIGMAFGMLLIWTVRIIGYIMIRRESMGFGDVMLMGFIGAWIGWHGALVTFFIAPFAGLFFTFFYGVFATLTTDAPDDDYEPHAEIPYGPFLCLAAVFYLIARCRFWDLFAPVFLDPLLICGLFLFCMLMLMILLGIIEGLKSFLRHE
ncbi:MAG: A24 family peptidase [Planctomycetia bacterium]|nr:A24 family peptidase [Planctomycetia bacterium]